MANHKNTTLSFNEIFNRTMELMDREARKRLNLFDGHRPVWQRPVCVYCSATRGQGHQADCRGVLIRESKYAALYAACLEEL